MTTTVTTLAGAEPFATNGALRRIYILGGEGSGKTSLAQRLADGLGIPISQLDYAAWRGESGGSLALFDPRYQPPERLVPRPLEERLDLMERLAARDGWVAEGKHLWWTAALLPRAQLIVWLDHVPYHLAARRVLGRAARSGGRSFRQHTGHRRFTRFRDYAVHSMQLLRQLRTLLHYYRGPASDEADPNDYRWSITRASTERFLQPFAAKVVRIRTHAELDALAELVTRGGPGGAPSTGGADDDGTEPAGIGQDAVGG